MHYDFLFQQFGINHSSCAMKVGTDGVLLGAWAKGGQRIVDIGTGTGLIALMMAQRYPSACVIGVDIDVAAASQAKSNASTSPFSSRVQIVQAEALSWLMQRSTQDGEWDSIVCNPPYYANNLPSRDDSRDMARNADFLPLDKLFNVARQVLSRDGQLSLVLPIENYRRAENAIAEAGLHMHRYCQVATKEGKPPKRVLLAVGRRPTMHPQVSQEVLTSPEGNRSQWYQSLTKDFYL